MPAKVLGSVEGFQCCSRKLHSHQAGSLGVRPCQKAASGGASCLQNPSVQWTGGRSLRLAPGDTLALWREFYNRPRRPRRSRDIYECFSTVDIAAPERCSAITHFGFRRDAARWHGFDRESKVIFGHRSDDPEVRILHNQPSESDLFARPHEIFVAIRNQAGSNVCHNVPLEFLWLSITTIGKAFNVNPTRAVSTGPAIHEVVLRPLVLSGSVTTSC